MTYVEWIRVRGVLRCLAIVLGVLIVVSLGLRIGFARYLNDDNVFLKHIQTQPGTKISHVILPNGVPETIIVDPSENTRVTIDNLGYGGRHIVVTEPRSRSGAHHFDKVSIGSVEVTESAKGQVETTVVDTNGAVPFVFYMAIANLIALVVATILGAPFARENDGHLEIALTKPHDRITLALATMGVDALAILASSAMTIVALIICQSMFEVPHFDLSGVNFESILLGIALPLAWYAMLNAATASMKRGYGPVVGFAWPVALLVVLFGVVIPWGDSLLGRTMHDVFWTISRIDPLTYVNTSGNSFSTISTHFGPVILIETVLLLIYATLAILQWRRVEA